MVLGSICALFEFWLPDGSMGKNIFIFGVDMSLSVHIIMRAAGFYFLILQKHINSKQKNLKCENVPCVKEIFQETTQLIAWKKLYWMGMCTIFILIIELLMLVILSIFINILRKNMV